VQRAGCPSGEKLLLPDDIGAPHRLSEPLDSFSFDRGNRRVERRLVGGKSMVPHRAAHSDDRSSVPHEVRIFALLESGIRRVVNSRR
jgi:hypothetical protein